jgi:hypothetical protein
MLRVARRFSGVTDPLHARPHAAATTVWPKTSWTMSRRESGQVACPFDSTQEPDALVAHVRICAGGAG